MLKQPKKPTENNNNRFSLVIFNATKIPKNNDDKTFTIKIVFKENTLILREIYFIKILKSKPKVLPIKIYIKLSNSKLYILIHPFVVLLGFSIILLVNNSTLAQISSSLTSHFCKTNNEEPVLRNNNFLALVSGKVYRAQFAFNIISFELFKMLYWFKFLCIPPAGNVIGQISANPIKQIFFIIFFIIYLMLPYLNLRYEFQ